MLSTACAAASVPRGRRGYQLNLGGDQPSQSVYCYYRWFRDSRTYDRNAPHRYNPALANTTVVSQTASSSDANDSMR